MSSKVSNVAILVRLIFAIIIMGLAIFLPAGTFLWIEAWIYLIFLFGFFGIVIIYFPKRDPELVKKRMDMKIKENWDKVFIIITGIAFTALFIIPGFDAVRFQWSFVPIVVKIVGFGGFLLSLILNFLVMRENTYLSRIVEIQKERGHKVITTGPYKVIRHPMYTAFVLLVISHCLALGSYYSLIPAVVIIIALIYRTKREDEMLHKQLEGYKEYAQKTKYKLIPGIW